MGGELAPSPAYAAGRVFAANEYARLAAISLGDAPSLAWEYFEGLPEVSSPVATDEFVFMANGYGIVTCLDGETGELVYEGGRVPVPATFTASPVAFDGKILLTSEDGDTFVMRAGPVHEIIHTNSLDEPVYASPALAAGTIFIRGERHLFAIR